MVLVVRLTMVLAATMPRLPMRMAALFCEFDGPCFSSPMGDAPVAVCGWHGQDTVQSRPRCAKTGLIGRSPTNPIGVGGSSAALEKGEGGN